MNFLTQLLCSIVNKICQLEGEVFAAILIIWSGCKLLAYMMTEDIASAGDTLLTLPIYSGNIQSYHTMKQIGWSLRLLNPDISPEVRERSSTARKLVFR